MTAAAPEIWLVRHGETEWSATGRHTSRTDVPLTDRGVAAAEALGERLADTSFDLVMTSPRARSRRTAELAGFPEAHVEDDLVEWDYGSYEGITTAEIRETVPGWTVWTHASPGGETADAVAQRLDRAVARARAHGGRVLLFGHGHSSCALTARWLGLPATEGRLFHLDTATVSVLGYHREQAVVMRWNGH